MASLPLLLLLPPNPLQRLTKLTLAKESCQFPFPKNAADPPDLQTAEGKGDQTQLEISQVHFTHIYFHMMNQRQQGKSPCQNKKGHSS
jgi:hypothetical protein